MVLQSYSYSDSLHHSIDVLCVYSFQGSDHKEYSSMLHKALEGAIILETFPKTTVDVFALVLESGGSESINCIIWCQHDLEYGI